MAHTIHLRNLIVLNVALLFIRDTDAGISSRRILPTEVELREGGEAQVHLVQVLKDEATCYLRTPLLVNCNLKLVGFENTSCDERVHYWPFNDSCGFYITNVQKQDEGLWRLTSQNDKEERVVDVVMITVLDKFIEIPGEVELINERGYNLKFYDVNQYCIMHRPHDTYAMIQDNECSVDIPQISAVDHGNWSAIVGVRGLVEEVVKTMTLSIFYEHMESGYTASSNSEALHLYCNYIALDNRLSLCRFVQSAVEKIGLRLREGMRKGRYEYYGKGLDMGECGMTIQSPQEKDYGTWYCLISPQNKPIIVKAIQVSKITNQTLISDKTKRDVVISSNTSCTSPVITTEGNFLHLECFSSEPLNYCWFSQPDGEVYKNENVSDTTFFSNRSQLEVQSETAWLGRCAIMIEQAECKHNGTWICHMGPALPSVELTKEIHVRIAKTPLAAMQKFVSQGDDFRVTFQCKTAPYAMALKYCRFQSPIGFGVNVNEQVTEINPIVYDNVRYWYSGEGLAAGHCGLVVEPANSMHEGNWTCAALIELLKDNEPSDTIHFSYDKLALSPGSGSSTAAIISIVFGSLGLVIALILLIVFGIRFQKIYRNRLRQNQNVNLTQTQDELSLDTMQTNISILSRPSTSRGNVTDGSNSGRSSSNNSNDNRSNTSSSDKSNDDPNQTYL